MQEIFQELGQYLREHLADNVLLFIAGSLGSALYIHRNDNKLTKKQKFIRIFFGGATAVFLTELVVLILSTYTDIELTTGANGGIGFFLGHVGMEGVTSLMFKIDKFKNLKK